MPRRPFAFTMGTIAWPLVRKRSPISYPILRYRFSFVKHVFLVRSFYSYTRITPAIEKAIGSSVCPIVCPLYVVSRQRCGDLDYIHSVPTDNSETLHIPIRDLGQTMTAHIWIDYQTRSSFAAVKENF